MVSSCGCNRGNVVGATVTAATGSGAAGQVAGSLACKTNQKIVYTAVVGVSTAIGGYFAKFGEYFNYQSKVINYEPFALSSDTPGYEMNVVRTSVKMLGTSEDDLMVACPQGSKIFAKGGLNYVVVGSGEDELYYSLCSTDVINSKVGVIEGFSPAQDKIKFFCTKKTVYPEDIKIIHDKVDNTDVTYIEVAGENKISAIALIGDISIEVSDIILNEVWS
ncbi:MAG: hypothetical protein N4A31_06860 [Rickettsiales bacterium]|jgi:Ca2+-binding RTX toxin-like protein|nr:hypothetical protein [Rickettsiales bacterium]